MKKILLIQVAFLTLCFRSFSQDFPDSIYSDKDSLIIAKLFRKDFKQYICEPASKIFKDKDINSYKRFQLKRGGRLNIITGFLLYYTDKFYLNIEVKGTLIQPANDTKPLQYYFEKMKKMKIIIMEIPLHLWIKSG